MLVAVEGSSMGQTCDILFVRLLSVGFLAHPSTTCSWWAFVIPRCPSSVVRSVSCINNWLVFIVEATVLIQSSWSLVRMFASMKSRPSSKLDHVGLKTRSLGQVLENPYVHSRGHNFNPILINLARMFVEMISMSSSKLGHVGSKTRSLGQIL